MWAEFCLASLVGAILLYGPGYVFLRAIRLPNIAALVCAPLFAVAAYCALGIIFHYAAARSSALTVGISAFAIALVVYLTSSLLRRRKPAHFVSKEATEGRFDARCVALYVLVGLSVALVVFVMPLNGPNSSVQTYDNVNHFSLVQSFAESGNWSTLHTSAYLSVSNPHANPLPGMSYYPAGWHILCAMLVDGLGVGVSLAANAINFLFVAVVFPSSMALLMRYLFPDNRTIVLFGALCPLALGAFPWVLIEVWPLYPNAVSLALLPALVTCFMVVCARDRSRAERAGFGAVVVIGFVCMAFLQPNSVFAATVFLIPYCIYRIGCEADRRFARTRHRCIGVIISCVIAFALIVAAWALVYKVPFMQGIVGYYWAPTASKAQGLISVVGMAFVGSAVQPIAALFVALGVLYTLRHRQHLWLTCSYLFMCFIYYVSAVDGDTWLKHAVSGFWYTDPYRTAACAAIFALPLLAMGLYGAYATLRKALALLGVENHSMKGALPAIVVVSVFAFLNFLPPRALPGAGSGAFQGIISTATALNDGSAVGVYDDDKHSFVKRVEQLVPKEALIVNQPYDGSFLAYGLDGLNLYYRDMSGYGAEYEQPESKIIRTSLDTLASDAGVQDALQLVGAQYVLILERNFDRAEELFIHYKPNDWTGIEGIVDETPGFEVVLEDGDMRLYRITNADTLQ